MLTFLFTCFNKSSQTLTKLQNNKPSVLVKNCFLWHNIAFIEGANAKCLTT